MTAARPASPLRHRRGAVAGVLGIVLVVLVALNLGMGAVTLDPAEVAGVVARRLGLGFGEEPGPGVDAVVWTIRMPRILLGMTVGAGLAAAGAALQGLFRNPLADPHLLGIGPGAAIGAVIGSVVWGTQGSILLGAAAGILVALLLRRVARRATGDPARFILVGVALGAALTAWVGFIVFASDRSTVPPMEFWLLGSLSSATWRGLGTTFLLIGGAALLLVVSSRSLDLMALGEREAGHLGVNVPATILGVLMAVGAITGSSVGAVGVVGFVGLVVPNALRRLIGPSHRSLLLTSMLGGAAFVLLADLAARTLISPVEIAVGLLAAVIGGPFLLMMLSRARLA